MRRLSASERIGPPLGLELKAYLIAERILARGISSRIIMQKRDLLALELGVFDSG